MQSESLAVLIGVGMTFVIGLVKRWVPLTESQSYAILFTACLVGATVARLIEKSWQVSEVIYDFSAVLAASQLVYAIAFKYFGIEKFVEGSKK